MSSIPWTEAVIREVEDRVRMATDATRDDRHYMHRCSGLCNVVQIATLNLHMQSRIPKGGRQLSQISLGNAIKELLDRYGVNKSDWKGQFVDDYPIEMIILGDLPKNEKKERILTVTYGAKNWEGQGLQLRLELLEIFKEELRRCSQN